MKEFGASFRNRDGTILARTDGSTVCWSPRRPSRFSAYDEASGDATILRCLDCPGCREFDYRRHRGRLQEFYSKAKGPLWLLSLECFHSTRSALRRLMNLIGTNVDAGNSYLLGNTGVASIATGAKPPALVRIGHRNVRLSVKRILNPSRGRAWRPLRIVFSTPRSEYGAQVKRFYHRCLPQAPRRTWAVVTRRGVSQSFGAKIDGLRACRDGVGIFPPEAWRLPRRRHVRGPEAKRFARGLTSVESLVHASPYYGALLMDGRRVSALPHKEYRSTESAGGYKSSLSMTGDELRQWVARMQNLARGRPPN